LTRDLAAENVDSSLRRGQHGARQVHLSLVVGGIDLNKQFACFDPLEIDDSDRGDLAENAGAQSSDVRTHISVVGRL
jgi:hypothetical protein